MDSVALAQEALLKTLLLATICFTISKLTRQPFVNCSIIYWAAWSVGLLMLILTERNDWLRYHFTDLSKELVVNTNIGMAIGFSLSFILIKGKSSMQIRHKAAVDSAIWLNTHFSKSVLAALFLIGIILLVARTSQGGLDLTALRESYLLRQGSFLQRIASHLNVLCGLVVMLVAIEDSNSRINLKRLLILIAATAPASLAQGGRTFLLFSIMTYGVTLLASRSMRDTRTFLRAREVTELCLLLSVLLGLFSIMGWKRGGYGDELALFQNIVIWPTSSLAALDQWAQVAGASNLGYGSLLFDFPLQWAEVLGASDNLRVGQQQWDYAMDEFGRNYHPAAVVPPTIITTFIFDFGMDSLMLTTSLFGLALQSTYALVMRRCELSSIMVGSQLLMVSLMTIQVNALQNAFYVSVFWICIIGWISRKRSKIGRTRISTIEEQVRRAS